MRLSYLAAELRRRPLRTVAAVSSLAVGVGLFVSLQAYSSGYRQAARAPLAEIGADIVAQRQGVRPQGFEGIVFPHSTAPLHRDDVAAIEALPGVEAVGEALFFWSFEGDDFLVGLGLDPDASVGPGRLRAGVRAGRFLEPADRGVVVADDSFAAQHGLRVGDQVTVGGRQWGIVGLVDTSRAGQVASANVYLPVSEARALVAAAPNVRAVHDIRPDDANVVFVRAEASRGPAVAGRIGEVLGPDALVTTPRSFDSVLGATFGLIDRFGFLVAMVALLVAAAGFMRAAVAGLAERRRDVALLRAVGWAKRNVVAQLTGETMATGALGTAGGLVLALVVTRVLSSTHVTVPVPWELSPTPHFLPGGAREVAVTVSLPARVAPGTASASLALTLGLTAIISVWLARRSAAVKPAEAWRGE